MKTYYWRYNKLSGSQKALDALTAIGLITTQTRVQIKSISSPCKVGPGKCGMLICPMEVCYSLVM